MIGPDLRRRIAAIVPLLGSDAENEALAAARGIERTLKGAGHDLSDLAAVISPALPIKPSRAGAHSWRDIAAWCSKYGAGLLNDRELQFVDDLAARPPRQLSPRQQAWLQLIESRLAMRRAG